MNISHFVVSTKDLCLRTEDKKTNPIIYKSCQSFLLDIPGQKGGKFLFFDKLSLATPEQLLIIIVYRLIVAFIRCSLRVQYNGVSSKVSSVLYSIEHYRKTAF